MKIQEIIETKILRSVKHAISHDEARYVLTGINVRNLNGFMTFTATNGRYLISIQGPSVGDNDFNVIIPVVVPAGAKVMMEIDTDSKTISYFSPRKVTYELIDGTYPDFLSVIPKQEAALDAALINVSHLETFIKAAKAYKSDAGLFLSPQKRDANIIALHDCPEWFGLIMPMTGMTKIEIPAWLKTA